MKGLPLVLNVKRLVDKCPLKKKNVFSYDIHITHDILILMKLLWLKIRQLIMFFKKNFISKKSNL